ncbi:hypothetical protein JMUB7518_27760 [Staphylococcus aureus]
MCNDTLELLRIKDENIKYINQEIDVIIKGKKATVVNAVLTYKPSACYCCGVKNEGQIHKHGKRVSRITCLLYTSPSPRDYAASRMPSSA